MKLISYDMQSLSLFLVFQYKQYWWWWWFRLTELAISSCLPTVLDPFYNITVSIIIFIAIIIIISSSSSKMSVY